MATETTTPPEHELDLDALEQDATARIEDLEQQRQKLSLDALTDRDAAQALADVESMLESARAEVERAQLARNERGRREGEAREASDAKLRQAAERRAAKLREELRTSETAVDQRMAALAEQLASHRRLLARLGRELRAAGDRGPRVDPGWATAPLAFALARGGARDAVDLGLVTGRPAPLARDLTPAERS